MEILIEFIGANKDICDYIHYLEDKDLVDIGSFGGLNNSDKSDIMFELDKRYTKLFIDFIKNIEAIDREEKLNKILNG